MNSYVLPESLRITEDTFPAFLASLLDFPQSLHPLSLLARIRRTGPQLEG
jgi:hypothetical protein